MVLVDLFSGIGGFSLAAEWAGIQPVLQVEIDPWCQKVLAKHWPHVRRIADVREVTAEIVADAISKPKLGQTEQADPGRIRGEARMVAEDSGDCGARPIILSGGFPCQPFSLAGKRRGKEDDRHLWPEMFRIVQECKPDWVVGENVAGFVNMALDDCAADLERVGYEVWPLVVPACAVNAPHRRDRCWIVAHASDQRPSRTEGEPQHGNAVEFVGDGGAEEDAANSNPTGLAHRAGERRRESAPGGTWLRGTGGYGAVPDREQGSPGYAERPTQSCLCRVADGLPAGLDGFVGQWDNGEWPGVPRVATGIKDCVNRLKGLGNAIVPQVAYEIFKAIAEIEHDD
jgi:DNA (cytosine-5)-methyltransferase 1